MDTPQGGGFRDRIGTEIAVWEREGLVQPEQAEALRARYGLLAGETPQTLHQSRLIYVLSILGVLLVGVGVILLIGANWQHIPKWVRLALLVGSTAAAYFGGYRLAHGRSNYPKVGLALLLLGSLLYGASIFLIWQTFHLSDTGPGQGDEAKAVLFWFLGVLPLAYVLLSPLHLTLSLVLGGIWLILLLARWNAAMPQTVAAVLLGLGVLLYAVGRLHARSDRWRALEMPYQWLGLVALFGTLYAFSYRDFWYVYGSTAGLLGTVPDLVLTVAAVVTVALLLLEGNRSRVTLAEGTALLALLVLVWMGIGTQSFMVENTYTGQTSGHLWVMALFNLVLLAAEVGVVTVGWARRQRGLVDAGLLMFFVQVVTRYFDLLGGMLQGGLMFIGAGIILVAAGVALERSRRSLLRSMTQRSES